MKVSKYESHPVQNPYSVSSCFQTPREASPHCPVPLLCLTHLAPPVPGVPGRPPPTAPFPALSHFSPLSGLCQFYMPRDCVTIAYSCSPDTAQVPGDAQHVSAKGKHQETCLDSSGCFPRMFPAADLQPPPSGKVKASSGFQTRGLLFSPTVICYKPRQ